MNWEDTETFERRVPTASDNIALGGHGVVVSAPGATFNAYITGHGTGTFTIANGGELTPVHHDGMRFHQGFTVEDGGKLFGGRLTIRTHVTVDEGGEMVGGGATLVDRRTITVNGTWKPDEVGVGGFAHLRPAFILGGGSTMVIGATGTIQMSLFGDDNNRHIRLANGTSLDWGSAAAIELVPEVPEGEADVYEPEIGHFWTLWRPHTDGSTHPDDFTMIAGDGSNIVLPGLADGLSLDLSQWETDGRVTVIPEPASGGLFALGMVLLLRRRR